MPARGGTKDRTCLEGKSIDSFREAIKSQVTLDAYERRLAEFLRQNNFNVDQFVTQSKNDSSWAQKIILD